MKSSPLRAPAPGPTSGRASELREDSPDNHVTDSHAPPLLPQLSGVHPEHVPVVRVSPGQSPLPLRSPDPSRAILQQTPGSSAFNSVSTSRRTSTSSQSSTHSNHSVNAVHSIHHHSIHSLTHSSRDNMY